MDADLFGKDIRLAWICCNGRGGTCSGWKIPIYVFSHSEIE